MSVLNIETYSKYIKVILKPTKNFPEGKNFFYTDNDDIAINLVNSRTWFLDKERNDAIKVKANCSFSHVFKKDYAFMLTGQDFENLAHLNSITYDCRECNFEPLSQSHIMRNQITRGYFTSEQNGNIFFEVRPIRANNINYTGLGAKNEFEAIKLVNLREKELYSDFYFDFKQYRRGSEDILDKEICDIYTPEQATYEHIKRHVESNPWYAYRFGLEDYCKENDIVIPDFDLDKDGFMIDNITGKKLCPC